MDRRYIVLDVFTDQPLAGNPLAVVLDGADLSDERMQAIALEFNLSETVFVLPPERPGHSARVRIFTPATELPFAGHPTVGAAIAVAEVQFGAIDEEADAVVVLEENVGPVRCAVVVRPGGRGRAVFDLPKLPEPLGFDVHKDLVAAAVGLEPSEVGFENHVPCAFSAGVPYTFVPVRDLAAAARVRLDPKAAASVFGSTGTRGFYVYTRETEYIANDFHARMLTAPALGIREDPATGSAAAAFAGVLMRFDGARDGEHPHIIEQGYEMGRPSHILLELLVAGGRLSGARIAGEAVVIARGVLMV